jgi:Zn-finger nucleic acid-binding protein
MDCPRCKLALGPDRYEGVDVHRCAECWGYWLDRGEFTRITTVRDLVFSAEERAAILDRARSQAAARTPAADPTIPCPRCAKVMEKISFNVTAPITVDRCPQHGIWLDTHELKLAQVLAEDAAAVRNLFFQKLAES